MGYRVLGRRTSYQRPLDFEPMNHDESLMPIASRFALLATLPPLLEENVEEVKDMADPVTVVKAAQAAGHRVIFVSMGTVVVGDNEDVGGWNAQMLDPDGVRHGLTGRQMCHAVMGPTFTWVLGIAVVVPTQLPHEIRLMST